MPLPSRSVAASSSSELIINPRSFLSSGGHPLKRSERMEGRAGGTLDCHFVGHMRQWRAVPPRASCSLFPECLDFPMRFGWIELFSCGGESRLSRRQSLKEDRLPAAQSQPRRLCAQLWSLERLAGPPESPFPPIATIFMVCPFWNAASIGVDAAPAHHADGCGAPAKRQDNLFFGLGHRPKDDAQRRRRPGPRRSA